MFDETYRISKYYETYYMQNQYKYKIFTSQKTIRSTKRNISVPKCGFGK